MARDGRIVFWTTVIEIDRGKTVFYLYQRHKNQAYMLLGMFWPGLESHRGNREIASRAAQRGPSFRPGRLEGSSPHRCWKWQ